MYYNTIDFGNAIRNIRSNLNFTQKNVCDLTGINENTMRRIENGKVLPRQETLDLLSTVYKQDISLVFLACRMDGFGEYTDLMDEIERSFEASNPEQLSKCLTLLIMHKESNMSQFYRDLLQQMIHLIEGAIALLEYNNFDLSYDHFLKGIKITNETFSYDTYQEHHYNKLELQLLMNLAVTEEAKQNYKVSLELLNFCVYTLEENPDLKKGILPTKIFLNASYTNHVCDKHESALFFAQKGIEYNVLTRSQYANGHLYARKGFAELNLNKSQHLDSFKKAYFYHEVLGQEDLKNLLVRVLLEKKGIDLIKEV